MNCNASYISRLIVAVMMILILGSFSSICFGQFTPQPQSPEFRDQQWQEQQREDQQWRPSNQDERQWSPPSGFEARQQSNFRVANAFQNNQDGGGTSTAEPDTAPQAEATNKAAAETAPAQAAPAPPADRPTTNPPTLAANGSNGSKPTVTLDTIDAELEEVDALPKSEDPIIGEIQSLYQKAKLNITEAQEFRDSHSQFQNDIQTAAQQIEQAQALLQQISGESKLEFDEKTHLEQLPPINELESLRVAKEVELQTLAEQAKSLSSTNRQTRITEIEQQVTDTNEKLQELALQLKKTPASDNQFFIRAKRTNLLAEQDMLQAKLKAIRTEALSYDATADLPAIERAYSGKLTNQLNKEIAIIDEAIHRRHENEIETLKAIAVETQQQVILPLKPLALDNVTLTQTMGTLINDIDKLSRQSTQIKIETGRIEREQATTESRIRVVGLSDSFGRMLQRNRSHLIEARKGQTASNLLNRKISDSQIAMFRWEDESTLIEDIESSAIEVVDSLQRQQAFANIPAEALEKYKQTAFDDATKLLTRRSNILNKLQDLEDQRFQELVEIRRAQSEQEKACDAYSEIIDENILWLRNAPAMGLADVKEISTASMNLALPDNWRSVAESIRYSLTKKFPTSALIIMASVAMFLFRHRMVGELNRTGEKAKKRGCRSFRLTLSAFVQTILLSLTRLSPLMAIGLLLTLNRVGSPFSTSLGWALINTSLIAFPFELLNQACRKNGLVQCHYAWTENLRILLKRNFDWMLPFAVPVLLVLLMLPMLGATMNIGNTAVDTSAIGNLVSGGQVNGGLGDPTAQNTIASESFGLTQTNLADGFSSSESWNRLGRLLLLGLLVIATIFTGSVFYPTGPLYSDSNTLTGTASARYRFRFLTYVATVGTPIVLALIAIVGYYYSAIRIGESTVKTVALAIVVILLYSSAMRFLLVRRRHMRYEQLVNQRNQARLAAEQKDAAVAASGSADVLEIDLQNEPGLDITDVSRQARELTAVIFLLIAGGVLLSIWQYVLPATRIMDGIELWDVELSGRTEVVTLRDVMFSTIMFALTYFGVRNMPGMLELLLLQKLPLDAGARYAVTSIFRYILLVIGGILALGYLKIPWSNYSWLVAAISVGLGFGLQEIVANFVSGLILLLERPVRVGDVVTIDGTTGIVSRIQMRATTVTNWDNQELVVPNKDLISGKLLNWTLSSVVNRLSLTFGVAYGTDPTFVRQLVIDAISSNRALLKEPKPMVTFEEFGDSSLNFKLRCCVSTVERRWQIIHDLNVAINAALKEHDIEIPFPQRDLHIIDSRSPVELINQDANANHATSENSNEKK